MHKKKQFQTHPIGVSDEKDLKSLRITHKNTQLISYVCKGCGKLCNLKLQKMTKLLCKGCKGKSTCLERYGVTTPRNLDWVVEKMKQTNLERYGVEWSQQNTTIKEKQSKTIKRKSPEVRLTSLQKAKQTCLERSV